MRVVCALETAWLRGLGPLWGRHAKISRNYVPNGRTLWYCVEHYSISYGTCTPRVLFSLDPSSLHFVVKLLRTEKHSLKMRMRNAVIVSSFKLQRSHTEEMTHGYYLRYLFYSLQTKWSLCRQSQSRKMGPLTRNRVITRVGTLIVATIYLQLIQNRYMFWSFTVLQCSHQHCVQLIASNVQVVGYL